MNAHAEMTVWKYQIPDPFETVLHLPSGATILHAAMQKCVPTIWALVNPRLTTIEDRRFVLIGTGRPLPLDVVVEHIGTIMDDPFVWHVFEVK